MSGMGISYALRGLTRICPGTCYAMSSTDVAAVCLRAPYEMPGTESVYGAMVGRIAADGPSTIDLRGARRHVLSWARRERKCSTVLRARSKCSTVLGSSAWYLSEA
eukprot:3941441-Rhodomonas_salina.4